MRRLISLFVIFSILFNLSGATYASASDEQKIITGLQSRVSIKTSDGYYDKTYELTDSEATIIIDLASMADLQQFKNLSKDGKKTFMNKLAQDHWSEYFGAAICYPVVKYDGYIYAIASTSHIGSDHEMGLNDYENGQKLVFKPEMGIVEGFNEGVKITTVTLKEAGVISNSNTMVPAATLIQALGGSVTVDQKSKLVVLKYDKTVVSGKVDSKQVKINNQLVPLQVPFKIINGKLMVSVQLLKSAFDAKAFIKYDENLYEKFISSIELDFGKTQVTVPINDLYEKYSRYIGKNSWFLGHSSLIYDSQNNDAYIDNLSEVKIVNVQRDASLSKYIVVTFSYKNKTYTARLRESNFDSDFFLTSPYSQYSFSPQVWEKIRNHEISIGMTTDMVFLSWGNYEDNLRSQNANGVTNLWSYPASNDKNHYLYFVNDILQSITTY